jgi:hypothetical protein
MSGVPAEGGVAWHGVPTERMPAWDRVFAAEPGRMDLNALCPVCGVAALHRWYDGGASRSNDSSRRGLVKRGGLWEWCSHCRSYVHYSAVAPDWWIDPLDVDRASLTAEPEAIESARRRVTGEV